MSPPTRIAEIGREAVDIEFATEPLIEPAIDNLLKLHDSLFCAANSKSLLLRKLTSGHLEKTPADVVDPHQMKMCRKAWAKPRKRAFISQIECMSRAARHCAKCSH